MICTDSNYALGQMYIFYAFANIHIYRQDKRANDEYQEKTMEHAEVINEEARIEHQELSVANLDINVLDINTLYEWLDRPITDGDDELSV
ncbi:hypothetical protein MNBD_GAMMA25-888 [hydrothermal vent metagenome]|uniref:Uncharacterized protein n=1 Tax=hydrothermal vent metagenome TaxID=652676 RepID=A0A3B1B9J6_9ZZZZ